MGMGEKFASAAGSTDALGLALRNLSDVVPRLQEYDAADGSGDLAKLRGHIWTVRQQIMEEQTQPEEDGLQQEPICPFATASPIAADSVSEPQVEFFPAASADRGFNDGSPGLTFRNAGYGHRY
jgi:hypothetical protein